MITKKPSKLIEVMIITLLITQVVISGGVVYKLNQMEELITSSAYKGIQQPAPSFIEGVSIGNAPTKGNLNAKIVIVEFADYECPYCREGEEKIDEILSIYGDKLLFAFRDFPLEESHQNAFKAAEAAHCAEDQGKFWEMHKLLFNNQKNLKIEDLHNYASQLLLDMDLFTKCLDTGKHIERIRQDISDGETYQVYGTPTFFVNGIRVVGTESLQQTIELVISEIEINGKEDK